MGKAKEISALWSQIKPQIGEMVRLCHEVEDHAEVTADAYQRGYEARLNDAWEAARKIFSMDGEVRETLLHNCFFKDIIENISASEAIERIRQYEQEKEEQIQVGDEVENTQTGVRFIVTHMWVNNHGEKGVSGFNRDCSAFSTTIELIRKTGRHFPEIAEVFAKMKETDNG